MQVAGSDAPYDVLVIGLGAAGAAALHFVATKGVRAAGIDIALPPHELGSSHGETRLCRVSHAEGPAYVPLMKRSLSLWRDVERACGRALFSPTGIYYAGAPGGPFIQATLSTARDHGVGYAPNAEIAGVTMPSGWVRFVETGSGFLYPERAIAACLELARARGAAVLTARALTLEARGDSIVVHTSAGSIHAHKVICAAGARACELLPDCKPFLQTQRRTLHWFADPDQQYALGAGFKPFLFETEEGRLLYGFPDVGTGVKIAEHRTGSDDGPMDAIERTVTPAERAEIARLARPYFPGLGPIVKSAVCVYPMSRDEHFVIGAHPRRPNVTLAIGLSGHGFKFAPVIGEAAAALCLGTRPAVDLAPFSPARFFD